MNPNLEDEPPVGNPVSGSAGYNATSIAGLVGIASALAFVMLLTNCSPVTRAVSLGGSAPANAALASGWSGPGPVGKVTVRSYPKWRCAIVEGTNQNDAYMSLSNFMRSEGIPVSSPVEVRGVFDHRGWNFNSISFPYPGRNVGTTGFKSSNVLVRDNPGVKVMSYAWSGDDGQASLASAKAQLDAEARRRGTRLTTYRLLNYDSGNIRELQAFVR